jgi:cell wall-associated NlpC family hydrolase
VLEERNYVRILKLGAKAFIPVVMATSLLVSSAPAAPASAYVALVPGSEAAQIIKIAKAQLGDPWRYGATGPYAFDCSGLVLYSFKAAGDYNVVGAGSYRSAKSLYYWFRERGRTSRTNAAPGDLVVWGGGSHIGIYLGYGYAISTLTSGVRIHRVSALTAPFTAYLRTGMNR